MLFIALFTGVPGKASNKAPPPKSKPSAYTKNEILSQPFRRPVKSPKQTKDPSTQRPSDDAPTQKTDELNLSFWYARNLDSDCNA